jgi:tetratricopeptide (TPR) repeat protein
MIVKEARILIFALLISAPLHADVISDTTHGKELLFQRDYPAAFELFKKIERDYPDSPAGFFGQMAAWQIMMYENLDFRFRGEYEEVEQKFETTVSKMLQNDPTPWNLFVAGSAYGMRGFYYMRDNKWFRALGSAVRGVQLMKRAVWMDPNLIDAKLGAGMYNYWRSVMTKNINFLPFFGDRRKEGIAEVKEVIEKGVYSKDLAEANLAFIYGQENKYKKARLIVDKYLALYPNNIIFRLFSGRLYSWTKDYDKSIEEFKKVMKTDPAMTKCLYYIGVVMTKKHGGILEAENYFNDFLMTDPEKEWAESAKKQIKQLK